MFKTRTQGFTLIELMVSLSVASIILTVAVPGFQTIVQNNRMTTDLNRLVTDLNLARIEAIKRGDDVTMCKRNSTGTECNDTSAWEQGWIIFSDPNRNGTVDSGEEVIRVNAELDASITLTYRKNRVTFTSQGFAYGFAGSFVMSDARGVSYTKKRIISNTGRIRIG
jgi:type IV fimbrial biogenesis protein FimT